MPSSPPGARVAFARPCGRARVVRARARERWTVRKTRVGLRADDARRTVARDAVCAKEPRESARAGSRLSARADSRGSFARACSRAFAPSHALEARVSRENRRDARRHAMPSSPPGARVAFARPCGRARVVRARARERWTVRKTRVGLRADDARRTVARDAVCAMSTSGARRHHARAATRGERLGMGFRLEASASADAAINTSRRCYEGRGDDRARPRRTRTRRDRRDAWCD